MMRHKPNGIDAIDLSSHTTMTTTTKQPRKASSSNTSTSSNSVIVSPIDSNTTTNNNHSFTSSKTLHTMEKAIYKQRLSAAAEPAVILPDQAAGADRLLNHHHHHHRLHSQQPQSQDHSQDQDQDASNFLDLDDDDEEEEDEFDRLMDSIPPSPPSSPPRELLPDRLYALYDFEGPDPNHLQLTRNDPVELLNDEDNYWWLVKNLNNYKIGFVPAEYLENYDERLARLNCWKNEQHEKTSKQSLIERLESQDQIILVNGDKLIDFNSNANASFSATGTLATTINGSTSSIRKVAFQLDNEHNNNNNNKINNNDDSEGEDDDDNNSHKRQEVLSEIYSDYTPLVISKKQQQQQHITEDNSTITALKAMTASIQTQPDDDEEHEHLEQDNSFLSNQNFLVKSLDDYYITSPMQRPPQQIFKEDSIGSFSSDTTIATSTTMTTTATMNGASPNLNIDYTRDNERNLNNSIKLLDDFIREQEQDQDDQDEEHDDTEIQEAEDADIETDKESSTSTSSEEERDISALKSSGINTPLTSESYLNNNDSIVEKVQQQQHQNLLPASLSCAPVTATATATAKYHPLVHELFDDLIKEIDELSSIIKAHF